MSTTSKIATVSSTTLREDLSDVITNIDPTDTPFISNIGKGKATGYKHEWLKDTFASAALNQQAEAATANAAAIGAGTRLANYPTILAKWFDISDLLQAVDSAGQMSKISYQTAKALKELSRDMEYTLINEDTGSTSDTFKSYGVKYYLKSGANNYYGFGGSGATSNLLTEELYVARCQAVWVYGGKVDMVLAPAAQKKRISAFNGSNRQTINQDAGSKKIINVVDFYESDFGVQRIYPERFILKDNTNYDWIFFLQKDTWKLCTIIPVKVEKLARTGLSQIVQISTTVTLESRAADANAAIRYAYDQ